jgi:hypothetical protein
MSKLTEKERWGFEGIMKEDLLAIHARFMTQVKDFWGVGRKEVLKRNGFDKLMEEKEELIKLRGDTITKIHMIEEQLESVPLRPEQVVELGGNSNEYGKYQGANFYGIPVQSQIDYQIVEYIRAYINLDIPSKVLVDLGKSCMRELTMAGTFEEAREAYSKFYSMNFRKYGVDIPPRLTEVKKQLNLEATKEVLKLENKMPEVL